MSSLVTDQGILHFESIGRGEPLILLHGWVNSWDVWREVMISLAGRENHRVYALDFWGFGDSAGLKKNTYSAYCLTSYVDMVRQFMDRLGIDSAPVAGHSMGGTVALQLALTHPQRVEKLVAVGSPIVGNSINPFLKLAGYSWIAQLVWRFSFIRSTIVLLLLAGDSRQVRRMIFRDVQRATMESFFRSIGNLRNTDLRSDLPRLAVPALGIYGRRDNIVSPANAQLFAKGIHGSKVAIMDHSRHFPMSDEPDRFISTMSTFLHQNGRKANWTHAGQIST